MNNSDILLIIDKMLSGINPVTDAILSPGNLIMHPTVQQALSVSTRPFAIVVEGIILKPHRKNEKRPWSSLDDSSLLNAYNNGVPTDVLARLYQRTEIAIHSRKTYLTRWHPISQ